jgi:DNA-binding PadR family transcriptional regulator
MYLNHSSLITHSLTHSLTHSFATVPLHQLVSLCAACLLFLVVPVDVTCALPLSRLLPYSLTHSLMSSPALGSPPHGELSIDQQRLLYLLSHYHTASLPLSTPHISVLVFEGCQEPDDDDSENEVSISHRSNDINLHVSDKFTFTYNFFQSFADIQPGVQVQIFASMVLKNDLRFFKKQGLVDEEKVDTETGLENCYRLTEAGVDVVKSKVSEKSKATVNNIVYAPGTANLVSVKVKDKSFYIGTDNSSYEKKSAITRPQEIADAAAAEESEDEDEIEKEKQRQNFKLSKVQQNLSDTPSDNKSKACVIQ